MKDTLRTATLMLFAATFLMSCDKDDDFSSGWDDNVLNAVPATLDRNAQDDVLLATVDIQDLVADYIDETYPDAKSYDLLEVQPQFGIVVAPQAASLDHVAEFDIYAVQGSEEELIAMISSNDQQGIISLEGVDVNLADMADEPVMFYARPQYSGDGSDEVSVEVTLGFAFNATGKR